MSINKIVYRLKRNRTTEKIIYFATRCMYAPFLLVPSDKKTVLFSSYMSKKYACSPKALYLAMSKNPAFAHYRLVWVFDDLERFTDLPDLRRARLVRDKSFLFYYYCARAGFWITNSRFPERLIKKQSQKYIMTWHGTPLKKLAHDIEVVSANAKYSKDFLMEKYDRDARRYDYFLSPSAFASEKFESSFDLRRLKGKKIFLELGYPRNDALFDSSDIDMLKERLHIPAGKKVILYAPTWRDNQHTETLGYTYRIPLDFKELQKNLGDEYLILFRAHYFITESFDFSAHQSFVLDVSGVDDINDLYKVSDILVTDYSSVFFDFANLERPMIFFMYDLEEYQNVLRGFYFDIAELPGPIVTSQEELIDSIRNIDKINEKYHEKYKKFTSKFCYLDDGAASSRVLDIVFRDA